MKEIKNPISAKQTRKQNELVDLLKWKTNFVDKVLILVLRKHLYKETNR